METWVLLKLKKLAASKLQENPQDPMAGAVTTLVDEVLRLRNALGEIAYDAFKDDDMRQIARNAL